MQFKGLFIISCLLLLTLTVRAQEITLVASGDGATKTDATTAALRSAVEQAFGTFVSSNTTILNDELVRDEIATLSNGNIKSYKELSCIKEPDGMYFVTVSAVVSINKLISFAKSHGSAAEFAGQTFLVNVRLRELNKKNEKLALENLLSQMNEWKSHLFNGKIKVLDPKSSGGGYKVPVELEVRTSATFPDIYDVIINTLSSLSLTPSEVKEYRANDENITLVVKDFNMNQYETGWKYKEYGPEDFYYLRNDQMEISSLLGQLCDILNDAYKGVKVKEKGGKGKVLGINNDDFLFKVKYVPNYPGPFNKNMARAPFINFGPTVKTGIGNDRKGLQLKRDANQTVTKQTLTFDYPNMEDLGQITGYETKNSINK